MLTKFCSCGTKIPITQSKCNKCKDNKKANDKYYDKHYRQHKEIYSNTVWARLTSLCKQRCNGLDLYAYYKYNKIVRGTLSHHIVPIEDDYTLAYCIDNLIYLSTRSHAEVHSQYNTSEETKRALQDDLRGYMHKWKAGGR